MPLIDIVDLKYAHHRKQMKGPFLIFIGKIETVLTQKEQLILFQNRRFCSVSVCKSCGWTAKCHSCDKQHTIKEQSSVIIADTPKHLLKNAKHVVV